ncbi:MAG TPA: hypothetical protein EYG38_00070, partial [Verrucomicrobia bacterium]|nr:hypothetical protein [Verrucomicrobiota bacterium]
ILTNGLPVLEQSVGANSPVINSPIGDTNQWRFYQFNNSLEGGMGDNTPAPGTNVAFVVFIPPNESKARNLDADLDLYVSTNPSLTNLNVGALDDAFKSIGPGGTETIFFTNAVIGDVFYIGVKSEDQQAAQFGLIAFSSNVPFDEVDDFGNRIVNGFPPGVPITDGSAELPSAAYMFAIPTVPSIIEEVSVNMTLNHDSIGDLLGNLSHDQDFVVLNNHTLNNGSSATFHSFSYNDGNSGRSFSSTPTDGPGSLNNFIGNSSGGAWILTMVDNALNHNGQINELTVKIRGVPFDDDLNRPLAVLPNRWFFRVINVPEGVVRLDVILSQMSDSLNLYLRKDITPTTTDFDKQALIDPPGGILSLGVNDIPPLQQARYFIGVFNPNATVVNFHLNTDLIFGLLEDNRELVSSGEEVSEIIDDAANQFLIPVDRDRQITDVKVGLRVDHPRLSDLDVRLTSPQGTEVLLIESRGGTNVTALGSGLIEDGFIYTSFTADTNLTTEVIKFAEAPFTSTATFISISNSEFENEEPGVRLFPATVDGWRVITNSITVIEDASIAHQGTKFIDLEIGEISRTFSTPDGGEFLLQFAYRKAPENEESIINGQVILNNSIHSFITASTEWVVHEVRFTADSDDTVINLAPVLRQPGLLIDSITLSEPGGNAFYIPEENLEAFDGESAIGDWILELEDRRVGFNLLDDSTSAANLLSWNLDLTFAPILRTAILLTNGVPYEGSVERNEIEYFIVDVPRSATIATNFLTGQGLFLTGDQDGVPV